VVGKGRWTMLTLTLCSAGAAADVRRVVTALDAGDKAIAMFDSCMTLDSGSSDTPSAVLWTTNAAPVARPARPRPMPAFNAVHETCPEHARLLPDKKPGACRSSCSN
jgi:hypothetical protein